MKTTTKPKIDNTAIIRALSKCPIMLDKLIDKEIIWNPEWKHFKVIRLNNTYLLFEGHKMVFYSPSFDVVKMELIERFHFFRLHTAQLSQHKIPNQLTIKK